MAYNRGITLWSTPCMKKETFIQLYNDILQKVKFLYTQLKLDTQEKTKGRTLAIPNCETISLAIFKQKNHIATKKSIFRIFQPPCVYKTLVVNMNRVARLAMVILALMMRVNRCDSHIIKHTDSTDIPVCSLKNAPRHKTMKGFATWGHTGKGRFYGLKLHLTTDLKQKVLALRITSGNIYDGHVFMKLNKGLYGIFVADAAYLAKKLGEQFYIEHKRILFAAPRKNMQRIITEWQYSLYNTRMLIEPNFRNLKLFYGLVTSMPRSVSGYLANYIFSLLAYLIA